jgi:hypothetical protein
LHRFIKSSVWIVTRWPSDGHRVFACPRVAANPASVDSENLSCLPRSAATESVLSEIVDCLRKDYCI